MTPDLGGRSLSRRFRCTCRIESCSFPRTIHVQSSADPQVVHLPQLAALRDRFHDPFGLATDCIGETMRMSNLSGWDVAILAVAAYISIVSLVRLMRHRRDDVVARLQVQVEAAQKRKRVEERRAKQRRARGQRIKLQSPDKSAA